MSTHAQLGCVAKHLLWGACTVLTVSVIVSGLLAWGVAQAANACPESGDDWW